jgi:hypothetical protein
MKYTFLLCFFLYFTQCFSQVKIYKGTQAFSNDLLFEIKDHTVYRVNSSANKIDFLYIDGQEIFLKERKFFTDCLYTIHKNAIYKGNSISYGDVLYTLTDGKLYLGQSSFPNDCLFTFEKGVIYKGQSTSYFDILMSYENATPYDLLIICCIIAPY